MDLSHIRTMNSSDPRFEKWALNILEAEESDFSGDESDNDPDFISEHETDSENEWNEGEEDDSENSGTTGSEDNTKTYYGKNRYKWSAQVPSKNVRTRSCNIISHLPGVIGPAKMLGEECTEKMSWGCLITHDILEEIVLRTNEKLQSIRGKYFDSERTDVRDVDLIELKAFIGLLFYSAIFKSNNEDLDSIFATDGTGREVFRCVMSKKRFQVILMALRFDDQSSRAERRKTDRLAPISMIYNNFVQNCKNNYCIGQYACIDEMLVGFRGKCLFRMYMPNKPRKYGIKILALTDARTHYFLNGYVYTGVGSDGETLTEEEKKWVNRHKQSFA